MTRIVRLNFTYTIGKATSCASRTRNTFWKMGKKEWATKRMNCRSAPLKNVLTIGRAQDFYFS